MNLFKIENIKERLLRLIKDGEIWGKLKGYALKIMVL